MITDWKLAYNSDWEPTTHTFLCLMLNKSEENRELEEKENELVMFKADSLRDKSHIKAKKSLRVTIQDHSGQCLAQHQENIAKRGAI